jgi:tetratricopeptide (TPR) repeat protein
MGISDSALETMANGDTLEGQKRLFSGEPAPTDMLTRLNRCLYGAAEQNPDLIEDEQERLLEQLPKTRSTAQAVLLYNLGCIALFNDDIQDARQRFAEVMKLEPHNRFSRHNLAYANELLAEYDQAKAHYNAVLAQDPGMILSRMNLALLRLQLGEVDSGLDDLRQLHQEFPRNMGVLLYLCRSLLASGARDDAQAVLELLDRRRDWEEYLDLRECHAFALYVLDKHSEAEAAFRDLVAANGGNLFARLGLIKVLAAQGNFQELRAQLERYQELNPPQSVQSILDDVRAL